MKPTLMIAAAGALALLAAPAFAATGATGTVAVSGSVGSKCSISAGTVTPLEENDLSQSNGKVVSAFTGTTSESFLVLCTTSNPGLSLVATPLVYAGGNNTTPGYTNTVDYQANLAVTPAAGPVVNLAYTTNEVAEPPTATVSLGGPIANNGGSNVTVSIGLPHTTVPGVELEAAGADGYAGTVTFTISPS